MSVENQVGKMQAAAQNADEAIKRADVLSKKHAQAKEKDMPEIPAHLRGNAEVEQAAQHELDALKRNMTLRERIEAARKKLAEGQTVRPEASEPKYSQENAREKSLMLEVMVMLRNGYEPAAQDVEDALSLLKGHEAQMPPQSIKEERDRSDKLFVGFLNLLKRKDIELSTVQRAKLLELLTKVEIKQQEVQAKEDALERARKESLLKKRKP